MLVPSFNDLAIVLQIIDAASAVAVGGNSSILICVRRSKQLIADSLCMYKL